MITAAAVFYFLEAKVIESELHFYVNDSFPKPLLSLILFLVLRVDQSPPIISFSQGQVVISGIEVSSRRHPELWRGLVPVGKAQNR